MPEIKDWLRRCWLKENYMRVVAQVLEEAAGSGGSNWTFSPMVKVESLPEGERDGRDSKTVGRRAQNGPWEF